MPRQFARTSCLLAGVLTLTGAASPNPAAAQWFVQRVDQFGTVTNNAAEAFATLASVEGENGWRLHISCGEGKRLALLLGRRGLAAPPAGTTPTAALTVSDSQKTLLSTTLRLEWAGGQYGVVATTVLLEALAKGQQAEISVDGGRVRDRFTLAGATAALGALSACIQPATGRQAAPQRERTGDFRAGGGRDGSAWRYLLVENSVAIASARQSGVGRFVELACVHPDPRRLARRAPEASTGYREYGRPGRFVVSFGSYFWDGQQGLRRPDIDDERELSLEAGGARQTARFQFDHEAGAMTAHLAFDAPIVGAIRSGSRLVVRDGGRLLATIPSEGADAAIGRALRFCAAEATPRASDATSHLAASPAVNGEATPAPEAPSRASLDRVEDRSLAMTPMLFYPMEGSSLNLHYGPRRVEGVAEPYPTSVAVSVFDLAGALAPEATPRVIGRFAAELILDGRGFGPHFREIRRTPAVAGVCLSHTIPDTPLPVVQVEVYRRPAPGQNHVRVSQPFVAWGGPADACDIAIRQVLREQPGLTSR